MLQDRGILAPGLFESISQDRHILETPLFVQEPGQLHDGRRHPGGVGGNGAAGIADDITKEVALGFRLGPPTSIPCRNQGCCGNDPGGVTLDSGSANISGGGCGTPALTGSL
jgi:hypothetical protein